VEDWENAHEEVKEEISQVKGEISQMKDQMTQILEAERDRKSSGESLVVNGGTSYPPGFHPHVSSRHTIYPPSSSSESSGHAVGLSLVPDVVIPPKFKVLEFDKYRGTICPRSHLTMYCQKMVCHTHDEKLFIHFFQDSLAGAALNWYMHLEPTHIHSWVDLADAIVKQYKFNMYTTPDRTQLQNMTMKKNETFKEYAQRWKEIAAQVEPPLYDKEMVAMFVNTLQPPFYEHMIGN